MTCKISSTTVDRRNSRLRQPYLSTQHLGHCAPCAPAHVWYAKHGISSNRLR